MKKYILITIIGLLGGIGELSKKYTLAPDTHVAEAKETLEDTGLMNQAGTEVQQTKELITCVKDWKQSIEKYLSQTKKDDEKKQEVLVRVENWLGNNEKKTSIQEKELEEIEKEAKELEQQISRHDRPLQEVKEKSLKVAEVAFELKISLENPVPKELLQQPEEELKEQQQAKQDTFDIQGLNVSSDEEDEEDKEGEEGDGAWEGRAGREPEDTLRSLPGIGLENTRQMGLSWKEVQRESRRRAGSRTSESHHSGSTTATSVLSAVRGKATDSYAKTKVDEWTKMATHGGDIETVLSGVGTPEIRKVIKGLGSKSFDTMRGMIESLLQCREESEIQKKKKKSKTGVDLRQAWVIEVAYTYCKVARQKKIKPNNSQGRGETIYESKTSADQIFQRLKNVECVKEAFLTSWTERSYLVEYWREVSKDQELMRDLLQENLTDREFDELLARASESKSLREDSKFTEFVMCQVTLKKERPEKWIVTISGKQTNLWAEWIKEGLPIKYYKIFTESKSVCVLVRVDPDIRGVKIRSSRNPDRKRIWALCYQACRYMNDKLEPEKMEETREACIKCGDQFLKKETIPLKDKFYLDQILQRLTDDARYLKERLELCLLQEEEVEEQMMVEDLKEDLSNPKCIEHAIRGQANSYWKLAQRYHLQGKALEWLKRERPTGDNPKQENRWLSLSITWLKELAKGDVELSTKEEQEYLIREVIPASIDLKRQQELLDISSKWWEKLVMGADQVEEVIEALQSIENKGQTLLRHAVQGFEFKGFEQHKEVYLKILKDHRGIINIWIQNLIPNQKGEVETRDGVRRLVKIIQDEEFKKLLEGTVYHGKEGWEFETVNRLLESVSILDNLIRAARNGRPEEYRNTREVVLQCVYQVAHTEAYWEKFSQEAPSKCSSWIAIIDKENELLMEQVGRCRIREYIVEKLVSKENYARMEQTCNDIVVGKGEQVTRGEEVSEQKRKEEARSEVRVQYSRVDEDYLNKLYLRMKKRAKEILDLKMQGDPSPKAVIILLEAGLTQLGKEAPTNGKRKKEIRYLLGLAKDYIRIALIESGQESEIENIVNIIVIEMKCFSKAGLGSYVSEVESVAILVVDYLASRRIETFMAVMEGLTQNPKYKGIKKGSGEGMLSQIAGKSRSVEKRLEETWKKLALDYLKRLGGRVSRTGKIIKLRSFHRLTLKEGDATWDILGVETKIESLSELFKTIRLWMEYEEGSGIKELSLWSQVYHLELQDLEVSKEERSKEKEEWQALLKYLENKEEGIQGMLITICIAQIESNFREGTPLMRKIRREHWENHGEGDEKIENFRIGLVKVLIKGNLQGGQVVKIVEMACTQDPIEEKFQQGRTSRRWDPRKCVRLWSQLEPSEQFDSILLEPMLQDIAASVEEFWNKVIPEMEYSRGPDSATALAGRFLNKMRGKIRGTSGWQQLSEQWSKSSGHCVLYRKYQDKLLTECNTLGEVRALRGTGVSAISRKTRQVNERKLEEVVQKRIVELNDAACLVTKEEEELYQSAEADREKEEKKEFEELGKLEGKKLESQEVNLGQGNSGTTREQEVKERKLVEQTRIRVIEAKAERVLLDTVEVVTILWNLTGNKDRRNLNEGKQWLKACQKEYDKFSSKRSRLWEIQQGQHQKVASIFVSKEYLEAWIGIFTALWSESMREELQQKEKRQRIMVKLDQIWGILLSPDEIGEVSSLLSNPKISSMIDLYQFCQGEGEVVRKNIVENTRSKRGAALKVVLGTNSLQRRPVVVVSGGQPDPYQEKEQHKDFMTRVERERLKVRSLKQEIEEKESPMRILERIVDVQSIGETSVEELMDICGENAIELRFISKYLSSKVLNGGKNIDNQIVEEVIRRAGSFESPEVTVNLLNELRENSVGSFWLKKQALLKTRLADLYQEEKDEFGLEWEFDSEKASKKKTANIPKLGDQVVAARRMASHERRQESIERLWYGVVVGTIQTREEYPAYSARLKQASVETKGKLKRYLIEHTEECMALFVRSRILAQKTEEWREGKEEHANEFVKRFIEVLKWVDRDLGGPEKVKKIIKESYRYLIMQPEDLEVSEIIFSIFKEAVEGNIINGRIVIDIVVEVINDLDREFHGKVPTIARKIKGIKESTTGKGFITTLVEQLKKVFTIDRLKEEYYRLRIVLMEVREHFGEWYESTSEEWGQSTFYKQQGKAEFLKRNAVARSA